MSTKKMNGRVQNKRDTAANWTKNNPILLDGEMALVVTNAGEVRRKIGDGVKHFVELPFDDEVLRSLVSTKTGRICSAEKPVSQPAGDYWDEIVQL